MQLIDSHCHLHLMDLSKYPGGLTAILDHAKSNHIVNLLCVATSLDEITDLEKIQSLDKSFIKISLGWHPSEAKIGQAYDINLLKSEILRVNRQNVIAIGEAGLDYYRGEDTKKEQLILFKEQIALAAELNLPLIVHTRAAMKDTLDLLSSQAAKSAGGVLHCFTESWEMAKHALDYGFFISFSGIITFNNAKELQEIVKKVPLDRILIETDSPYLAPVPHRGKPNEPAFVYYVAKRIAELKNLTIEQVAAATLANYKICFKTF